MFEIVWKECKTKGKKLQNVVENTIAFEYIFLIYERDSYLEICLMFYVVLL